MIIRVNEDQMLLLEKNQYELNGLTAIMRQFTGDSEFKQPSAEYEILLERYLKKYKEVEIIKNQLMKEYVVPEAGERGFVCNFDFARELISVEFAE
ncbi:MAG: hypothetical protein LBS84_05485 [Clostridiales bacterium]|jgi:hypothetical protein|nr:hypothetical protein [Clostridiales bacterium]